MSRPTFLTIDLDALRHNLERVRAFAPDRSVIAMVKANAYGHGIVRAAQALSAADALGVASIDEGMLLRDAGVTQPILLMEGLFNKDELIVADKNNFTLIVHHLPHVDMLENANVTKPLPVWLKINTGMHRLGIASEQINDVYKRLLQPAVKNPLG